MPGPMVRVTELFTTPVTLCQFGLDRLGLLCRVHPVAELDQEIVTLLPLRVMFSGMVGMVTASGMPVAEGPPKACIQPSLRLPTLT